MFEEEYNKLSNKDQETFAKVVNNLMLKSFVLRENYDRPTKMMKANPDYYFIERNIDLIRDYMQFSGWIVDKDSRLGVVQIANEYSDNRIRIDFLTSLIIYALRYAYEVEKEQNQMTEQVYFTTSSLLQLLIDKSLIRLDKRPSAMAFASSLRFLDNHNIIARIRGEFRERDFEFYIMPSILFVIDNEKINRIFDEVEKYGSEE